MNLMIMRIFFLQLGLMRGYYISSEQTSKITLNNFAFGSCFQGVYTANVTEKPDIFQTILANKPDLWVWLGDSAYVDYYQRDLNAFDPLKVEYYFNESKFDSYYNELDKKVPVIGVWDDHDYGFNDGDSSFPFKEKVKQLYLNFLNEPESSERRNKGTGLYQTYSFGVPDSHKTVRIILLDNRFYNIKSNGTYDNILGEEQWKWLEDTLEKSKETFIFICSGIQILPFNRGYTETWEKLSRQRLFDLLGRVKKNGVILLTGDLHMAQMLKTPCILPDVGYPLYEFTSSGLSHYCVCWYNICFQNCNLLFDYILPNEYYILPTIANYNFGKIDFQWGKNKETSKVIISLIDNKNYVRAQIGLEYAELTSKPNVEKDLQCYQRLTTKYKSLKDFWNALPKRKLFKVLYFLPYIIGISGVFFLILLSLKFLQILIKLFVIFVKKGLKIKIE